MRMTGGGLLQERLGTDSLPRPVESGLLTLDDVSLDFLLLSSPWSDASSISLPYELYTCDALSPNFSQCGILHTWLSSSPVDRANQLG